MPSLVKIKIEKGRDLPPMDRNASAEASTDAFVEVRLETHQQRTNTCRRSLNPVWNEEFQFDFIDDSILQDEPLELRCMDQDLYSSELIGVTYVDLNPLIMRTNFSNDRDLSIHGWYPLFDTARGIRGALLISVKLQFIGNENPFRDSSAGIQFFSASTLHNKCFFVQEYIEFVEELVLQDDPENSWQDYFKGNKASNDNRLKALYCLSAEVRRKLGKKVFECGGNAVLGYAFHLDTEGSSVIAARAYGTACRLLKVDDGNSAFSMPRIKFDSLLGDNSDVRKQLCVKGSIALMQKGDDETLYTRKNSVVSGSGTNSSLLLIQAVDDHIVSSSFFLPFGQETDFSIREGPRHNKPEFHSIEWLSSGNKAEGTKFFQSEVQLLTLFSFPSYVQIRLGGLVLARSVKFINKSESAVTEQDTREEWWKELRDEIRAHAKVLCCRYIIGYSETCTFHGDICILSAVGTAAELKGLVQPILLAPLTLESLWDSSGSNMFNQSRRSSVGDNHVLEMEYNHRDGSKQRSNSNDINRRLDTENHYGESTIDQFQSNRLSATFNKLRHKKRCTSTHIPYNHNTAPFSFMRLVPCLMCKRKWVPETVLATTELPLDIPIRGVGRHLEAKVCRLRKSASGEADAAKVSKLLPFIEYDLQRQITLKLKVMGMNAAFGYTCKIEVGSDMVIATAVCTAIYLESLPPPVSVQLNRTKESDIRLTSMHSDLEDLITFYRSNIVEPADDQRIRHVGFDDDHKDKFETSSVRSRSSSNSTTSTSSSSSDDISDGDDSSSLESPSSTESEESSDGDEETDLIQPETTNSRARSRSNSSGGKKADTLDAPEVKKKRFTKLRQAKDDGNKSKTRKPRKVIFKDSRPPFILELEDETDVDIISVLQDWICPVGIDMTNISCVPGCKENRVGSGKQITVLRRGKLLDQKFASQSQYFSSSRSNISNGLMSSALNKLFQEAYLKLCHSVKGMIPCQVLSLTHNLNAIEDGQVEIILTAVVHKTSSQKLRSQRFRTLSSQPESDTSGYEQQEASTKGSIWTVPRLEFSAESNARASPSMQLLTKDRASSQSFDYANFERSNRPRTASTASNESLTTIGLPPELLLFDPAHGEEDPNGGFSSISSRNFEQKSTKYDHTYYFDTYGSNTSSPIVRTRMPSLKTDIVSSGGPVQQENILQTPSGKLSSQGIDSRNAPDNIKVGGSTKKASAATAIILSNVVLTPLCEVPNARVKRYLGPVQLHFIKDAWTMRSEGSLGSFFYLLLSEVNAAARAHVAALGGNALLCHKIVPQEAGGKVARNQGYTMFSVSGDAVILEFQIDSNMDSSNFAPYSLVEAVY